MRKPLTKILVVGMFVSLLAAGLLVLWKGTGEGTFASVQIPQLPLPGKAIPKYVDPLPHFAGLRVMGTNLMVSMEEFQQMVLPAAMYAALPAPYNAGTYVWGYNVNGSGPLYPAFTIEAQRWMPTTVTYINNLWSPVLQQYLSVDKTLHWADPLDPMHTCMMSIMPGMPPTFPCDQPYSGPVPAVVHLHGAEVQSQFDGHPDSWFTPGMGYVGPAWMSNVYTYPNTQEATTLWFHDHALGVTRLNVYGGLAGFYFLRDWANVPMNLPGGPLDTTVVDDSDPLNPKIINPEIEVVIQDRMVDTNGQWLFPDFPPLNPEHPFWQPEFLGDVIVVNGKTWPFMNVEPRRYRFRFLNGSNARFYSMWLENRVTATPGPVFWQIGTDGGLLDTPVMVDPNSATMPMKLLLAPGERADLIIDFSGYAGQTLTLRNNARAPYPKGAAADPQTVGQIMQFRVVTPLSAPDNSYDPAIAAPGSLRPMNPIVPLAGAVPNVRRQLTLNEVMGPGGPLEVLLNNTKWDGTMSPGVDPIKFPDGITELPQNGSTEVWEIINITADAHPIHLHLVQFQLLSRQNFNVNKYNKAYNALFPGAVFVGAYGPPGPYDVPNLNGAVGGNPGIGAYLQGPVRPPEPNEFGWKDTVIMYPGQVTRIVVRFAPTDTPLGTTVPGTNYYFFDPRTEPGYVWHCHILDHEDNEMMRPYKVK